MLNAFTVDVEEWFHVCRAERHLPRERWDALESRVERGVDAIRALCDRHQIRATFFVLGWVAERHPAFVKSLHDDGHEIACHGYAHTILFDQRPLEFRADLARSTAILHDITGEPPIGYRAPEWSITRETAWAFDELARAGYRYDSSTLPSRLCGRPGLRRWPHTMLTSDGLLAEFPATTATLFRQQFPCLSGFSLRCAPTATLVQHLRRLNEAGRPVCLAIHPWEFDPDHPKAPMPAARGFAHYFRLHATAPRVETLCGTFSFGPMREALAACLPQFGELVRPERAPPEPALSLPKGPAGESNGGTESAPALRLGAETAGASLRAIGH